MHINIDKYLDFHLFPELKNFSALKASLDGWEMGISGIALDHYQYLHYQPLFPDDNYKAKLHSSSPVTVGILISGGGDNATAHADVHELRSNPITKCLVRHAIFGRSMLDDLLIESISHTKEVGKVVSSSKTLDTFFGSEVTITLLSGGIVLIATVVIYGLFDRFIIQKYLTKEPHTGKVKKRTPEIENENAKEMVIIKDWSTEEKTHSKLQSQQSTELD